MPDWGDDREKPPTGVPRQPIQPTAEQRAAWEAMGREKFRDPEHQRFAQSHRSTESLREAGRQGYLATAERYGRDYAADLLANHRRDTPTRPEREMTALLGELGKQEGRDYQREYKVAPGVYADFAVPERKLAVEVHGSAHEAAFFLERGMPAREERRSETYAREGWTVQVVTDRDLREGREGTARQLRGLLDNSIEERKTQMENGMGPTVQLLDEVAWERGEIVPVGQRVPVSVWLAKLAEWRMTLSLPPLSRITGGMYDGGHVLVGTGDTRLAFAVPKEALSLLRDRLTEREYGELTRRIGR